jgi:hypothetical protein
MASAAVTTWKNKFEQAKAASRRVRQKMGETTEALIDAGLSAGTGFALGAYAGSLKADANGKVHGFEVAGVPVPLAIAGITHAAALMGVGRGMEDRLRAIGTGALTVHAYGSGKKLMEARAVAGGTKVSGELPSRQGSGITQDMLAALAA